MFAQHGLFEIQLTVYSALSRLTDLGIYYITIYISYSIFPLSTRYEKDYINKITPFIFVQYSKQWSFYTQNLKKNIQDSEIFLPDIDDPLPSN